MTAALFKPRPVAPAHTRTQDTASASQLPTAQPENNSPPRTGRATSPHRQPAAPHAQAGTPAATAQPTTQVSLPNHTENGFAALGLRAELVRAVVEEGYTAPTPIQTQAIPVVLAGKDVLGGAQTGTGKTAGFVLPMLQRLLDNPKKTKSKAPRALVLAPTRELAAQVEDSVRTYGRHVPLRSTVIYGGVGMGPQVAALRDGVDIVVACPGRLLDHHSERTIDLSQVEVFVLDEADRMLDMGFIHDIKRVLAVLPPNRQNLLFSATFSDEIKALADRWLNSPTLVEVARRNSTVEVVAQSVVMAEKSQKSKLLQDIIKERQWFQVLVFTRTKHGANRLAEQLSKNGIPSLAIHGNKSQGARTKALAEFKSGTLQVLVATDIAARGIDIDQLPHVVNYELPNVPEDYVHRIGRTGRAGATGEALSLVARDELPYLKDIERLIKQTVPRLQIAGFTAAEPDANAVDEINDRPPLPPRGGRGPRGQPNAHQQKRAENTRAANLRRAEKRNAVERALPAPRTPSLGIAQKNFNIGNRNTQRGRTR